MITRRVFMGAGAGMVLASGLKAQSALDAATFGLVPDQTGDQSAAFQEMFEAAAGQAIYLPSGTYNLSEVALPANTALFSHGAPAVLQLAGGENVLFADDAENVHLSGLQFRGAGGKNPEASTGLLDLSGCTGFRVTDCAFSDAATSGINLYASSGVIRDCRISGMYTAGIAARDSTGLLIEGNTITDCQNLGVYLERGEPGYDGTIVTNNRISAIGWAEGGNGQNGNGVNAFRTGHVVISDNVIRDCAFSAVRVNATRNAQITGNSCTNLEEVAIFSEFEFSGSVISDNIIDEAAQGIAITNLDTGGHLAVCSGNIVRNIWPKSPTNPDTTPVGIGVEANTAVTGNVVENVPGVGIALGWGPFMSGLNVTGNVTVNCDIGYGVSVVEGVGAVVLNGNLASTSNNGAGFVGMEWNDVTVPDLRAVVDDYDFLTMSANKHLQTSD